MVNSRQIDLDQEEIEDIRVALMREVERIAKHYLNHNDASFMAHSDSLERVMHAMGKLR